MRLKLHPPQFPAHGSIFDINEDKISVKDSCPAVAAIQSIGSESKLLVLRHLLQGPKRFNELLRYSGINSKTLSAALKSLEQDRIVEREVISTRPFVVQYSLSPSGEALQPAFEAIGEWGRKWLPKHPEK